MLNLVRDPLGGLAGGALIGLTGLAPAMLLFGGCYLIATTLPGLQRDWAELNRRPVGRPDAEHSELATREIQA